jgi:phosphate-selective porin
MAMLSGGKKAASERGFDSPGPWKEKEVGERLKTRLRKPRVLEVGVFVLAALVLSGPAFGQDKKEEPPAVTSSRSFKLSGYTQFLYTYWETGLDSFAIPRARLSLSGDLLKTIRFRIQIDAVKSPALIDANVDFVFNPAYGLRIGQYYVPVSMENNTSDADMDTILRSLVVIALAPSRDLGSQGRDIGAMFMGQYSIAEYYLGVFNGAGINKADTNKAKDVSGRLILHPVKSLSLGGSFYKGRNNPVQNGPDVTRDRIGLEAAWLPGRFSLKGEFLSAKDNVTSKSGWYLQGGYFFIPKKLQAIVKWDTYDRDLDVSADRADLLTLGANWFIWGKTKLMVNYALYRIEGEGTTNQAVSVQFQAGF